MYTVILLSAHSGEHIRIIHIPVIPRNKDNITIESSSLKKGFVTYEVDAVHYVHNPEDEKFNVIIYVKNVTN